MASTGGTLYAIRAEGTSLVKIGYTAGSVQKRLKSLQTGQPLPLHIVAALRVEGDARQKEAWLHAFLAEERRRGEWFDVALETEDFAALVARAIAFGAAQEARAQAAKEEKRLRAFQGVTAFGTRVLNERKRQRLSREDLTQRMPESMRMHTNTLWSIEKGHTHNPRMDHLQALAQALGVSVPYLMGETDETGPGGRRLQRQRKDNPLG